MEYVITFDDGSEAYLAHHGVMGMKWGVRNAETQAKYAGGTGRAARKQDLRNSRYKQSSNIDKVTGDYFKANARINADRSSGKITKDQAKQQRIKAADAYEKNFYDARAKGRTERAAIKSEGKSDRAKARIMARAAGQNMYEKTTSKGAAYARRQSVGKRIAKGALLGTSGYASYNSARAAGKSRLSSMGYAAKGDFMGGSFAGYDAYAADQRRKAKKVTKAKYNN